jgi:hypothetical protein
MPMGFQIAGKDPIQPHRYPFDSSDSYLSDELVEDQPSAISPTVKSIRADLHLGVDEAFDPQNGVSPNNYREGDALRATERHILGYLGLIDTNTLNTMQSAA